jgi:hypothetical protein
MIPPEEYWIEIEKAMNDYADTNPMVCLVAYQWKPPCRVIAEAAYNIIEASLMDDYK